MGRLADDGKRREWMTRLTQFETSSLTVAEFCDWWGVSVATFHYWRRKLGDGAQSVEAPAGGNSRLPLDRNSFLPVRVASPPASMKVARPVHIQFPNGMRIRVALSDAVTLRDVVLAVSRLPSTREDAAC